MEDIRAGLLETDAEVVLRGGHLDKPVLLCNLSIVEGRKFVHLWKGCPILNKFLTGKNTNQRPLAASLAIENIAARRNAACRLALEDQSGSDTGDHGETEEDAKALDPTAALDLENGDAECQNQRKKKKQPELPLKMKMLKLPRFLPIEVEGAFEAPWCPLVLVEVASTAPAIEATTENFQALSALIDKDLASGECRRHRYPRKFAVTGEGAEKQSVYELPNKKGRFYNKVAVDRPCQRKRPYAKSYQTKRVKLPKSNKDISVGSHEGKAEENEEDCLS